MSDSTRSQNEYDHCSMLTTVAINVVYILSFILKYVALQVLVQEVLSLNIIISPQDGDSGHKNFDHYCTYFSTQKWKFYIIILPKVNRRVVKLQAHWHWTQTKSTVTMSVMNWCTALMCNEIWWTMIMQIKILHNIFFLFYKMVLNIYFHKYFQWSLVDDKNTMLSFITYAVSLKTCFCTVEIETSLSGELS